MAKADNKPYSYRRNLFTSKIQISRRLRNAIQSLVCVNYIIVIEFLHFFSMQTLIIFYYILLVVVYIFVSSSCICELLFPTPVCPMNFDSSSPLLSSLIRNVAFSVANSTKKISYFFSSTYTSVCLAIQAGDGLGLPPTVIYFRNISVRNIRKIKSPLFVFNGNFFEQNFP